MPNMYYNIQPLATDWVGTESIRVDPDKGRSHSSLSSVVDPNRLCSDLDPDLDPGSRVHSDSDSDPDPDPAPDPNRIRINSDPDPT